MKQEKKQALAPTVENLAEVAADVRASLEIIHSITPASPLSDATKTRLHGFQMWVGRIAQGDPNASIGRTLGSGITLRRMLEEDLTRFFETAIEGFINLADLVKSRAPHIFAENEATISRVLAAYTTAVNESKHLDQFVLPYNECRDLLVGLRSLAESFQREEERRAHAAKKGQSKQRAMKELEALAALQVA